MVDQARGTQTTVALFEEDTFGADPSVPDGQLLYHTGTGLSKQQNLLDSATITAARGKAKPFKGNINDSGAIGMELSAESIGTLLKHTMGDNTTTGAGPYSHALKIGDLPLSLTVEVDYGASQAGASRFLKHQGCRVNSAAFEFPTEGACTASFDMVGANAVPSATALDATLTDNGETTFSSFEASIEEGGAGIAIVKTCSINISNELDQDSYVIGSGGKRVALPEGQAMVTGSITALFAGTALLDKALAGTTSSLKITLSRGDGLGSAGNESIEFDIPNLVYEVATPPVDGPGGILITLPFKAFASGAELGMNITLKNAVAAI